MEEMIDDAMVKDASNSAAIPGLTWRIATSRIMLCFLLFYFFIPRDEFWDIADSPRLEYLSAQ